jgi:arylsulfatase A-like enzyme
VVGVNVLFVSIDSLTRKFLGAYDGSVEFDVETDNLDRFAERAATFDTHYAGSLPCMPARREWLAGVQEFLWRPWGPMEPFDRPLPRAAREEGVVTKLITDHFHYIQHGSNGFYEDFNGFEFVRGHEYDAHRTAPRDPPGRLVDQTVPPGGEPPTGVGFMNRGQYARNVADFDEDDETDFFAPKVFSRTAEWLRESDSDQWFCYVDSFDVHEPFHVPEPYASMYTDEDPRDPDLINWPNYGRVDEGRAELSDRQLQFVRSQFAGKVTMVDRWLGRVFDALDDTGAWDDTAVVVTSDHGHYLGEHGWIGKPEAPLYNVLAHTPLFVWHPDSPRAGERVDALTSAVDLYATILDLLEVPQPEHTTDHSRSLTPLLRGDTDSHRDWALYGYWGSSVNVTDGRYTYMHPCDPYVPARCHSTTMMSPYGWFTPDEPQTDAESGQFLPYTDSPVWRYEAPSHSRHEDPRLFDVTEDPDQQRDVADERPAACERMERTLVEALDALAAPEQQYERLGIDRESGQKNG